MALLLHCYNRLASAAESLAAGYHRAACYRPPTAGGHARGRARNATRRPCACARSQPLAETQQPHLTAGRAWGAGARVGCKGGGRAALWPARCLAALAINRRSVVCAECRPRYALGAESGP